MRSTRDSFEVVRTIGLALPDVEAAMKYDGSPVLKAAGCFMAGVAGHASAEPGSLVVRSRLEDREWLLADAPDTYYVTDHTSGTPWCWCDSRGSMTPHFAACCRRPGASRCRRHDGHVQCHKTAPIVRLTMPPARSEPPTTFSP